MARNVVAHIKGSAKSPYTISHWDDGREYSQSYECSCPAWTRVLDPKTHKRQFCKHIWQYMATTNQAITTAQKSTTEEMQKSVGIKTIENKKAIKAASSEVKKEEVNKNEQDAVARFKLIETD